VVGWGLLTLLRPPVDGCGCSTPRLGLDQEGLAHRAVGGVVPRERLVLMQPRRGSELVGFAEACGDVESVTVTAGGDAGAFDGLEHVAHSFRVVVVRAVCCLERDGGAAGRGEALQLRASGYRGVGGARSRVAGAPAALSCGCACGGGEGFDAGRN